MCLYSRLCACLGSLVRFGQDLRLYFRFASLPGWEVTWAPDPVRLVLGTRARQNYPLRSLARVGGRPWICSADGRATCGSSAKAPLQGRMQSETWTLFTLNPTPSPSLSALQRWSLAEFLVIPVRWDLGGPPREHIAGLAKQELSFRFSFSHWRDWVQRGPLCGTVQPSIGACRV